MTPATSSGGITRDAWLEGNVRLVQVPSFDDVRGSLLSFEFELLPFLPRRAFVVQDVPVDTIRGRHAHLKQRQILVCLAGSVEVEVRLHDHRQSITLDRPQAGLLIEAGVWCSQRFITDGSILLVLASGRYDPEGYAPEAVDRLE